METTMSRNGSTLIAELNGRLEGGAAAEKVHETLDEALLPEDRTLIIDLENLSYMSSAGLRTIARMAQSTTRAHTALILCSAKTHIRDLLTISGFDRLITVVGDLEEAKNRSENI